MNNRSSNRYCRIAYALDIIGERWMLLISRELIASPRRFTDLMHGLPGISTNRSWCADRFGNQMGFITWSNFQVSIQSFG